MSMIAIGGVIGAGLFVGSGVVMQSAGPAAVISFITTGTLVVLVIRMLGEMAVAAPAIGGFYEYSRLALGSMAGFLTGRMYWYFWIIVVALEAVAGAGLMRYRLPDAPSWVFTLSLVVIFTLTNLLSVRNHGEFEFWFAVTKVAAIVVFLFSGFVCVSGFWPGAGGGLSNLAACDGFLPDGIGPVPTGAAAGFYFGAVIVTIAAAESAEPERAVAKETNSVTTRVLIFCVGLFALVLMIVPWNDSSRIAARTSAPGMSSGPRSVSAHARGRPHGGALGPELGPLRVFQDADGSGEEGRRAPGSQGYPPTG